MLPFPKLSEKCQMHVCLAGNRYIDERWEDVFGIARSNKDQKCRKDRTWLENSYHRETENARINSLGSYVGTIKIKTKRFGVERRRCAIDARGILVSMDPEMQRIITSFRPIFNQSMPPKTAEQFKRDA